MRLLIVLLVTLSAAAQTFEQTASVRLTELSMSARAAAMGGASDALEPDPADLATNPALSASLRQPLLSVSAVQTTYDLVRTQIDEGDIALRFEPRSAAAFGHIAAVIPMRSFVAGLYARNEPRLHDGEVNFAPGLLPYEPLCLLEPCNYAHLLNSSPFERRERRYGATLALARGAFSFGAGAELQDLDESYAVTRIQLFPFTFDQERIVLRTSGRKLAANGGIRWRITPRVAVAAAYNHAPSRERTEDVCRSNIVAFERCTSDFHRLRTVTIDGADALRASLSVIPIERLVLTGEVVRRDSAALDDADTDGFFEGEYRNITELHAGAEYRLRGELSLRAGWWRQPSPIAGIDLFGPQGEDVDHLTFGFGVNLGSTRIDLAYDDADAPALRRAVLGVTYAFGR